MLHYSHAIDATSIYIVVCCVCQVYTPKIQDPCDNCQSQFICFCLSTITVRRPSMKHILSRNVVNNVVDPESSPSLVRASWRNHQPYFRTTTILECSKGTTTFVVRYGSCAPFSSDRSRSTVLVALAKSYKNVE